MQNPKEVRSVPGRADEVDQVEGRPQVIMVQAPRGGGWLDVAFRVLAGLAMAMIIALLAALLLVIVGLSGAMGAANSSLSNASSAIQQATSAIQGPLQSVLGQVQPDRPPPAQVSDGPEFSGLSQVAVGAEVGRSTRYVLTVSRIVKRDGATDPNQAQYAVLHRKLLTPAPRMVGPVQVGEDYDEADLYVYKGESFRLGSAIYQVNWISVQDNTIGLLQYRNSDAATGMLKFQLD